MTERQVRSRLRKGGAVLRKSRARSITARNQGHYMVVDSSTHAVIIGANFDATLKEIAEHFDLQVRGNTEVEITA